MQQSHRTRYPNRVQARAIAIADDRRRSRRLTAVICVTSLLLMLFAVIAASSARAEPAEDARGVIAEQIQAFLNDDAGAAYAFASPAIRKLYPDKDRFFAMVKRGYAPVYRPDNFSFGRSKIAGDMVLQEVLIKAPGGQDWTALYQLVRQTDGSFLINGVHMLKGMPGSPI